MLRSGLRVCFALIVMTVFQMQRTSKSLRAIFPVFDALEDELVTDAKHIIFYNGYTNPQSPAASFVVMEQQFQQIRRLAPNSTIHFTTIAYNGTEAILSLCETYHLTCRHLQHYNDGFETVTLAHLHKFCSQESNAIVTYLHPKGSHSARPDQTAWRTLLTEAALSSHCLSAVRHETFQCNICVLTFYWIWAHLPAGNIWSARCDYIAQLMDPFQYLDAATQLVTVEKRLRSTGQVKFTLVNDSQPLNFVGRYADEHWLTQHPDIRPCDCSNGWDIKHGFLTKRMIGPADFVLRRAPTVEQPPNVWHRRRNFIDAKRLIRNNTDRQLREYFFLAGHIESWLALYNNTPPADSWVWKWYPHGNFWRSQIDQHGAENVLDIVLTTNWTKVCEHAVDTSQLPCQPEWVGWHSSNRTLDRLDLSYN